MAKNQFSTDHEESSLIEDHPYEPRDEWWSLCKTCGLAQAAHSSSTEEAHEARRHAHIEYYGEAQLSERDKVSSIAYYSEDNPDDD